MTRSTAANQASARARGAVLALVGQHLDVGEPRGIVDGDVQVLSAGALDTIAAVACDAVAGPGDTAELLDIDMNELSGPLALITDDGRFRIEGGQPSETEAAQDGSDGRARQAEAAGDCGPVLRLSMAATVSAGRR